MLINRHGDSSILNNFFAGDNVIQTNRETEISLQTNRETEISLYNHNSVLSTANSTCHTLQTTIPGYTTRTKQYFDEHVNICYRI